MDAAVSWIFTALCKISILPNRGCCQLDRYQGCILAPCLTCNQDDNNDDDDDHVKDDHDDHDFNDDHDSNYNDDHDDGECRGGQSNTKAGDSGDIPPPSPG